MALRKYTRANPDLNPALVLDNPNLISRILKRQESSVIPTTSIKVDSCPNEWFFLEDLPFDLSFDLSLVRTRSKSALDDIVLDPEFILDLEVQKENS